MKIWALSSTVRANDYVLCSYIGKIYEDMGCKYCGKPISQKGGLAVHEIYYCKLNPDKKEKESNFVEYHRKIRAGEVKKPGSKRLESGQEEYHCRHCKKEILNKGSLKVHEIYDCKSNPERKGRKSNFIEYHRKLKTGEAKKEFGNQFIKAKLNGTQVKEG